MKNFFTYFLCFFFLGNIVAQETLSFKITNPRITFASPNNRLNFDVMVKATNNGTYLYASQIICNVNIANFNTITAPGVIKGTLIEGNFDDGNTIDVRYNTVQNWNSGNLNIFVIANPTFNGQTPSSGAYAEITTEWQKLFTVRFVITDLTGMAGISFQQNNMNGYQTYATGVAPWTGDYANPNLYEGFDLSDLYLTRMFSGGTGWSQAGGSVNWATSANTSVWDTTASAAVAGANATVNNLRIHTGGRLIVNPTGTLTVAGTLTNDAGNGGLVIKSDATGTGSILTNSAAPATVERYLTGPAVWHLISPPVSGQSIPSMVSASPFTMNVTKYGLGPYDNSIPSWVPYTTTTVATAGNFVPAKGYEAMMSSNFPLNFKGTLTVSNTTAAVQTGANDWNVIGNPFSTAIFINSPAHATDNFLTVNSALFPSGYESVYIWDPATGKYKIINNASAATHAQVGQAFFIKTGVTGNASFTTVMRTHSTAPFYKNTQSVWPKIELKAAIDNNSSETQIFYISGTTSGIDAGYDAGIFTAASTEKSIYTKIDGSDVDFGIQSISDNNYENQVVAVGLNAPQGSVVTFTTEVLNFPGNIMVFLEDRLTGTFIRLDEPGSAYSVVLNSASSGAGRFYIHTSSLYLGIDNRIAGQYAIVSLPVENKIRILGKVAPNSSATIYNISGQKMGYYTLSAGMENEIHFDCNTNGIYILKIQNGTTLINNKFNWVY